MNTQERPFFLSLSDQDRENAINRSKEFIKLMSYYRCAMMEIETKLNVLNEEFKFKFERNPINSISSRLKSPDSIYAKLERYGFESSLTSIEENLFDIAGIRVICPFVDDVYRIADALTGQDDVTLIKTKDYIKNPKPNGYRSLHLIVAIPIFLTNEKRIIRVEIQLRTLAMDFFASLEHQLTYKKDPAKSSEKIFKELYEISAQSAALDEKMNNIKNEILGQ